MMRNLCVDEGDLIQIDNVSLSVATYAKFQPQSVDFLDITNPKAVYPFGLLIVQYVIYKIREKRMCLAVVLVDNPCNEKFKVKFANLSIICN